MKLSFVVAVARNDVIGGNNQMPWSIRDDLRWFKKVTMGKPIIMGRNTFASIKRPLAGRDNIVLTRDPDFIADGTFLTRSVGAAVKLGASCAVRRGAEEICVIGGGTIYAQMMDRADRIYLTRVDASPEGDVHFPTLDLASWDQKSAGSVEKSAENQFSCEFFILERRRQRGRNL